MKRNNFLWLISILMLFPFSLVSCSDDDDEGSVGSTSELIGTWESVSRTYQWKEDGEIIDEGVENDSDIRVIFNEDGTCRMAEYYNGTWHWEDGGVWSYKNGKITIIGSGGDERESATVKELTSSKLVLEFHDKYMEDGISYEDYGLVEYRKISD